MNSLRGRLLVASPYLEDENFVRTVLLMVDHNEAGAIGLVLNRPSQTRLSNVLHVDREDCGKEECLSLGGPVDGQVVCLHSDVRFADVEILPDVYLASELSQIEQVITDQQSSFKVFWGYAGWGAGQLEAELSVGGWLIANATADDVFEDDEDLLWKRSVSLSGQQILRESLGIGSFPHDPTVN